MNRLATRRNTWQLWRDVARALAFGATLCALLVFAHRLLLLDLDVWVIFAIMSAATIFGVLQGLSRRVGAFEAALDADRSLGLNERLSSAIAFTQPSVKRTQSSTHSSTTWRQRLKKQPQSVTKSYVSSPSNTSLVPMLVEDAAGRAAALDPKKVIRIVWITPPKFCWRPLSRCSSSL
jgi:hypothetical protein